MWKSGKNTGRPGKTAVESFVEKIPVLNRKCGQKSFHRQVFHFPQKNVDAYMLPELFVMLDEMSRTTAEISGSLAMRSSILRIELNTVA